MKMSDECTDQTSDLCRCASGRHPRPRATARRAGWTLRSRQCVGFKLSAIFDVHGSQIHGVHIHLNDDKLSEVSVKIC